MLPRITSGSVVIVLILSAIGLPTQGRAAALDPPTAEAITTLLRSPRANLPATETRPVSEDLVPNRISILFNEDLSDFDIKDIETAYNIRHIEPIWAPNYVSFTTILPDKAIEDIRIDRRVLNASRVYVQHETTNDALYPEQWYLKNTGQSVFIGIARLIFPSRGIDALISRFPATTGADIRWEEGRSLNACKGLPCEGRGVIVAVVDSGIDSTHPDLQGQIDSSTSRSFVSTSQSDTTDVNGHGTFVAGLIAARADNNVGLAGVAPSSKIMALKSSVNKVFPTDATNSAILYAAANGAQVINMSFSGPVNASAAQRQAIFNSITSTAPWPILVAAAGNDGTSEYKVPASMDHVVSVASYDPDGLTSMFSQFNDRVDVSAPGGLIPGLRAAGTPQPVDCAITPYDASFGLPFSLTFEPTYGCTFNDSASVAVGGQYRIDSGTSMSSPIVAGAAALAKERWPRLTSDGFETLVRTSADDAGPMGYDPDYGAGKLNLERLLSFNFPPDTAGARMQFTKPTVMNSGADATQLSVQFLNYEGASDMSIVAADFSTVGLDPNLTLNLQSDDAGLLTYTSPLVSVPQSVQSGSYAVTLRLADLGGFSGTLGPVLLTVVPVGTNPSPPSSTPPPQTVVPDVGTSGPVNVTITSPKSGKDFSTRKKSVTFRGDVSPDVAVLTVKGVEQAIAPGSTTWQATVPLDEGENAINVMAQDIARVRQAQASVTITRDTEAPDAVANLRASSDGTMTRLSWRAPDGDISGYHIYRVNGTDFEQLDVTRSRSFAADGPGPFAVTAEDKAGNESDPADAPQARGGRTTGFSDVPASHFASMAIATLRERGIVQGHDGSFEPSSFITRAEFAKMLVGVRRVPIGTTSTSFRDVSKRSPLAGYIAALIAQGWARGEGDRFYPGRSVTRMEAGRMIVRADGLASSGDAGFTDVAPGDEMGIAAALQRADIATGQDGRFMPGRPLTRAEAAKMLVKLLPTTNT